MKNLHKRYKRFEEWEKQPHQVAPLSLRFIMSALPVARATRAITAPAVDSRPRLVAILSRTCYIYYES